MFRQVLRFISFRRFAFHFHAASKYFSSCAHAALAMPCHAPLARAVYARHDAPPPFYEFTMAPLARWRHAAMRCLPFFADATSHLSAAARYFFYAFTRRHVRALCCDQPKPIMPSHCRYAIACHAAGHRRRRRFLPSQRNRPCRLLPARDAWRRGASVYARLRASVPAAAPKTSAPRFCARCLLRIFAALMLLFTSRILSLMRGVC